MKKKILVLFLGFFLNYLFGFDNEFSISVYKPNFFYKERINERIVIKRKSKKLKGFLVKYSCKLKKINLNFNFKYIHGDTEYNGFTIKGKPLNITMRNTYIKNFEINFWYLLFGYRVYNKGISNFPGDYDEKYYWSYFGFNYKNKFSFYSNKIFIKPEFKFKKAINPIVESDFKITKEKFSLGKNTYGIEFSLPLYLKIYNNFYINLFYNYTYWKIERSETKTVSFYNTTYYIYEPSSKTVINSFGIGISYIF